VGWSTLPFLPLFQCVAWASSFRIGDSSGFAGIGVADSWQIRGKNGNDRGKNGKGGNADGNENGNGIRSRPSTADVRDDGHDCQAGIVGRLFICASLADVENLCSCE
jgi:hypothetical protein